MRLKPPSVFHGLPLDVRGAQSFLLTIEAYGSLAPKDTLHGDSAL